MLIPISLYQMNVSYGDVKLNTHKVAQAAKEASKRGSKILILPELWATGYVLEKASWYREWADHIYLKLLPSLCVEHDITIIGSNLFFVDDKYVYNRASVHHGRGVIAAYDKIHLFNRFNENRFLKAGRKISTFRCSSLSPKHVDPFDPVCGLSICYDIRFPELFVKYKKEAVSIVFTMAEWPQERSYQWRVLCRARAIENSVFTVSCNSVGTTGNKVFGGYSSVIDPVGNILVEGSSKDENLYTVELNVEKAVPFSFLDRRPEVYDVYS